VVLVWPTTKRCSSLPLYSRTYVLVCLFLYVHTHISGLACSFIDHFLPPFNFASSSSSVFGRVTQRRRVWLMRRCRGDNPSISDADNPRNDNSPTRVYIIILYKSMNSGLWSIAGSVIMRIIIHNYYIILSVSVSNTCIILYPW